MTTTSAVSASASSSPPGVGRTHAFEASRGEQIAFLPSYVLAACFLCLSSSWAPFPTLCQGTTLPLTQHHPPCLRLRQSGPKASIFPSLGAQFLRTHKPPQPPPRMHSTLLSRNPKLASAGQNCFISVSDRRRKATWIVPNQHNRFITRLLFFLSFSSLVIYALLPSLPSLPPLPLILSSSITSPFLATPHIQARGPPGGLVAAKELCSAPSLHPPLYSDQ